MLIFIIIIIFINNKNRDNIDEYYKENQKEFNLFFHKKLKKKINLGIYAYRIKDGGRARITALLMNYLNNIKIFNLYLFTILNKEDNEYKIPDNIKRDVIKNNLINKIIKKKIQILIYQLESPEEINLLNNIKKLKVLFYLHTSSFDWIYFNYSIFKSMYSAFTNSKYILSIVPFDNEYLFKKWGIRSVYLNNFITYDYNSTIQCDINLAKSILMIGRGDAKKKRFHIGIQAMEYINNEVPNIELEIISNLNRINNLKNLVDNLNLNNNIQFLGYLSSPEILYKNISLNIFPSISEAFPMVLCETKIYGIPSILLGLDYITVSTGGTAIIYNDSPESLSKEAIKILNNDKIKKELGMKARKSMKKFNNILLLSKWVELILSVYNGENYYLNFKDNNLDLNDYKLENIIKNQIELLKMREQRFNNITIKKFENFSYLQSLI